ncbi:BTB/POZ domain-containing protein [Hibiscus syriacus]|uniref:BTB/POZ domain-containing protein n=1 Tax=Hibiscus syriacus TaxID=106335 RepID=A0A6A2YTG2_HIBSY|nr:BTB/POZ domain-containing protein [Hibiscus syriacus]
MGIQKDVVKFNVGGRIFQTTATTLANAGRDSFSGALFDDNWDLRQHQSNSTQEFFIDRNPDCFAVLRTGDLYIPSNLSRSVTGRAPGDGTAIRAGPDGGYCVAHGSMVHVFDWMLEELPPINLYYPRVNDIGRVNTENVLINACERLGKGDGGMGEKRMVWSWSDIGAPLPVDEKRVRYAIAMEECNSICVVNEYDDLGFIDLRINGGSVRWSSRSRLLKGKMPDEACYPKLALHNGQLFSSMNDCISVFCGPDWVLTSRLRRSYGGSICDFSIGVTVSLHFTARKTCLMHGKLHLHRLYDSTPGLINVAVFPYFLLVT